MGARGGGSRCAFGVTGRGLSAGASTGGSSTAGAPPPDTKFLLASDGRADALSKQVVASLGGKGGGRGGRVQGKVAGPIKKAALQAALALLKAAGYAQCT